MEINVDDYVRDKNGRIGKVFDITNEPSVDVGIGIIPEVNAVWIDKDKINYLYQEDITKHSKDIIDLIEVGDYVNGCKITKINIKCPITNSKGVECKQEDKSYGYEGICFTYDNYDIKSILTKEQFEQNCYKVEKER